MKTMSIYEAITKGLSVKNKTSARISAKNVDIDLYAPWKVAEKAAYEAFYKYADARRKTAHMGEDATIDAETVSNAFKALRNLLTLIGDVNGHKLMPNDAMLNELASTTMCDVKTLIGEALAQKSVVDNLKTQYNDIHNGMNPEYVEKITTDYEVAKVRFAELCKLPESCKIETERVKLNAFCATLETKLALIVNEQDAMSWEELDKRDAAIKAERDAKRKANKNAKKSAK